MPPAPHPVHDADRIRVLESCAILDTHPEPAFDRLTALAARLCHAPVALVSLVDASRQWFKSHHGTPTTHTPRGMALCSYVVFTQETLIIEDTLQDPRVQDSELVTSPHGIRAYAGVPMTTVDGHTLGSFCVNDYVPRSFTPEEIADLQTLASFATAILELRREVNALVGARAQMDAALTYLTSHE